MIRPLNFIILLLVIRTSTMANNSDLFLFDENKIINEINCLTELEEYLNQNSGFTLSEMIIKNDCQLNNMNLPYPIFEVDSVTNSKTNRLLGIPGFWWGLPPSLAGSCAGGICCFYGAPILGSAGGIVGIGLVYYVTNDKIQTVNSLWGCIIGNVIGSLIAFYISIIYGQTVF